jgi:hypothetical protein
MKDSDVIFLVIFILIIAGWALLMIYAQTGTQPPFMP